MRKDRFNVGDVLVKKEKGQEPIHRKITAVRDSGYSWIYVDEEREIEFYSEDSRDPFFEWKWELVDMSENQIEKEVLYSGYYLTNDARLGSFHGYKTEDEKVIVTLVDILDGEKFFVDADEIRRLNHDEALYFADQIRGIVKPILWEVKPDYEEYDLYDGAIVVANTKEEAEEIANKELNELYYFWEMDKIEGIGSPQTWTATQVDINELMPKILFKSLRAG